MYSIIIPLTEKADEIKRYASLKAFNAALAYYKYTYPNGYSIGEKCYKFTRY